MSFVESNLTADEEVVFFSYGHWVAFVKPILATVALIGAWFFVPMFLHNMAASTQSTDFANQMLGGIPTYDRMGPTSLKVLVILALFCGAWFLFAWVKFIAAEYAITNERVIAKRGLIFRKTSEIPLTSVESMSLAQSIPARLMGYGDLLVTGRGNTSERLSNVPKPTRFRQMLQDWAEYARGVGSRPETG